MTDVHHIERGIHHNTLSNGYAVGGFSRQVFQKVGSKSPTFESHSGKFNKILISSLYTAEKDERNHTITSITILLFGLQYAFVKNYVGML